MKAYIDSCITCGGCSNIMDAAYKDGSVVCTNRGCVQYGILYARPSIELERVAKKEDTS